MRKVGDCLTFFFTFKSGGKERRESAGKTFSSGRRHKFQSTAGIRQVKGKALNKARNFRPFSTAGITSNGQKPEPDLFPLNGLSLEGYFVNVSLVSTDVSHVIAMLLQSELKAAHSEAPLYTPHVRDSGPWASLMTTFMKNSCIQG